MIINVFLHTIDYYRVIVTSTLILFGAVYVQGQEIWTTDQYLQYKYIDITLPFKENITFLTDKAKGMPLIDNYEFRTETDEMALEQQQFQFRFQFNSNDERKAYNRILEASKIRYSSLQARYILDFWEERYKNIIDLFFVQKEEVLLSQEYALLLDKKTVLKKLIDNKSQIDVEDWIRNENELFNLKLDSIALALNKNEISQKIFNTERSLPELNTSDFIDIEGLRKKVPKLLELTTLHPEKLIAKAEKDLADAEFQLETAEAKKWLNFAQIEYQSDSKLSFQREVSIATSITIPSKNNNRVKRNDAMLEILESSYKVQLEEVENERELRSEKAKFLALLDQFDEFKQLRDDQNLESIYSDFADNKIVSPTILISIKRSMLKNEKKQLNLEKDIYESYINLLTCKATFLFEPRQNYLSE
jgi:hypothetical protein